MILVPRADIHVVRSFPVAFHFGVTGRTPAETLSFKYMSRKKFMWTAIIFVTDCFTGVNF